MSVVEFAVSAGSVFRSLPFIVGLFAILYQKRSSITTLPNRILAFWNIFLRRHRSSSAALRSNSASFSIHSSVSIDRSSILSELDLNRDGSLHLSGVTRKPRLSEAADALFAPHGGKELSNM
jgi:hypothetical protein